MRAETGQAGDNKFQKARVVAAFPGPTGFDGGHDFFTQVRGATIRAVGTVEGVELEGGGLVIDFTPAGGDCVKRLVLAFNEQGAWVEWYGVSNQV